MDTEPSRPGIRWTTGGFLALLALVVLALLTFSFISRTAGWGVGFLAGLGVFLLGLVGEGLLYQRLAEIRDRGCFTPPGKRIDVGGYRLHLQVLGEPRAGPVVVLESGGGMTSSQWGWVAPEVAKFTRVVLYDRPGMGWSEDSPRPLEGREVVEALHQALAAVEIAPPYVLVGHALGGLLNRLYAACYPDEVAGMVLVDPRPERLEEVVPPGAFRRSARSEKFITTALRLGIYRLSGIATRVAAGLPEQQQAESVAFQCSSRHIPGVRSEIHVADSAAEHMRSLPADLGDLPVIVLSAGQPDVGFKGEARPKLTAVHSNLARQSTRGVHRMVEGADHYSIVQREEYTPAVTAAIREVVETVRGKGATHG
jgi:pimeloyl-ACP methyl ester carboxylesterase